MMREPTPEMIEAGAAAAHGESDWHRAADFTKVRHRACVAPIIKAALAAAPSPWRPIAEALKDGTPYLVRLRDEIYPTITPERPDLEKWNGIVAVMRNRSSEMNGFNDGWGFAAPVGMGGFSEEWIAGFMEIPAPPETEG